MIIYHRTSLFNSSAQTVVNTVNCVGVMGKGIAAAFKKRHPDMFESYRRVCEAKLLEPGKLWLWRGPEQWVLNFPTKKHWRSPSQLDWIEAGLQKFVLEYERQGIREIAFPKLGCGNGNLDWEVVRPMMERYLDPLPINVFIHDYEVDIGLPEHIEAIVSEGARRPLDQSADDFWQSLRCILKRIGSEMIDFETKQPFVADARDDLLLIESDSDRSYLDKDELVDAWRILTEGILTKKKLGMSSPNEASKLISLFSLLPSTRPVLIQRADGSRQEIAAEFCFNSGTQDSADRESQLSLTWR